MKKRLLAMLMAVAMMLSLLPTAAFAAYVDTEYLTVGESVQLKKGYDGQSTWTSSNSSVASVDQTGKVTANKEGNAVITQTYKVKEWILTWHGPMQVERVKTNEWYIGVFASTSGGTGSGGSNNTMTWSQVVTAEDGTHGKNLETSDTLKGKVAVQYFNGEQWITMNPYGSKSVTEANWGFITKYGVKIIANSGYEITGISLRCNDGKGGTSCNTFDKHSENMSQSYSHTEVSLTGSAMAALWKMHTDKGGAGKSGPHWLCVSIKASTFNVTYTYGNTAPEGATVAPEDNTEYSAGNTVIVKSVPSNVGDYVFAGWYYDADGDGTIGETELYTGGDTFAMPSKDVELVGYWYKPELSVEKVVTTIDGKAPEVNAETGAITTKAEVGDEIVWTITVTNSGTAAGSIYVNDILYKDATVAGTALTVEAPEGVTATDGKYTIPAGTTYEFEVSYTVTSDDYGKDLVNKVDINGDGTPDEEAPGVPVVSNVNYTVKHWFEKVDSEEYEQLTAYDDEIKSGVVGQLTAAEAKTVEGFTAKTFEQQSINADGSTVVNIYYDRQSYKVTYDYGTAPAGASNLPEEDTYKYGETVTIEPDATAPGYTFVGWSNSEISVSADATSFTMPADDVTLIGTWTANTNTVYKVEHYKQNLDGTYPETASETENLTGTTGATATATPKNFTGFTYAPNAEGTIASGEIAGDGSLVLKLYYTRNTYNVVYQITGSHFTNANYETQSDILFESPLSLIEDNMEKGGYVWSGWTGLPSTMPDHDVIVTGFYTAANNTAYKVEHYKQNLDGTGYDLAETENLTGTTGETATATAKTYEGFSFDANAEGTVQEGTIAADGSLVLKLYYTRNAYDIVYKITGDYFATENYKTIAGVKYGTNLSQIADDMAKQGYVWSGWAGLPESMPANNVTVTGSYTAATGTAYIVEHYKQNLDGSYPETASETENLTGTTGETATAEAKTYEGFTFDANAEGTVQKGTIAPDGSLVLKLFYTRNSYEVSYQYTNTPAGASDLPATVSYKYGASVTVADDATAPGYTFSGWNKDDFTMPAENVTITGSFSARNDLSYTVKYLEEGTNKALATDKVVNNQTFGSEVIENAINITGYTVVGDASKSLTIAVTDNVITFYYAVDIWDDPDNNTTDGDGTADKYQVLVRYESESASKGSVAPGLEVLTIYGDNQTPVASGNVTADGSTATAGDNYVFTKWSMTAMPEDYTALSDIATNTTGQIALNGVEGKNEFTFTAYFTEKDTTVDVNKAVTKITAPDGTAYETLTSAKVGDTITWTITAKNKGNVEQTLTLADELSNAANVTVKDSAGATVTTVTLSAGEEETYTATYTVAPSDAGDILINTAILKDGDTKKDEGSSDGVKVDPSLKIDKTVSKSTVTVGDKITYTIKVTNNTNTELKNIVVKDTMLGLEQTLDTLAAGASKDITKDYTVTTQNIGTLKNTATATDEANNTYEASVDTTVNKKPSKPSTDIPDKVPLETEDHYAYIIGYPDGNVKPAGNITRAEVATIFFRLLTDEARDLFWSTTNEYSDVAADQWFNNAISTLSNAGIINGYEDGSFRPNNPITRAEFSKIAVSFFSYVDEEYQGLFPDVPADKWYALYVEAAKELGLINGYEDGTFRPEQNITRAEACTIVNNTIQRNPHEDQLHEDMIVWPDNPAPGEVGHMWYYEEIQEATNSHDYTFANDYEDWTEILENRDWAALEKAWADSNDAPGGDVMK